MKTKLPGADCPLYPACALVLVLLTSTAALAQEAVVGRAFAKDTLPEGRAQSFDAPDDGNGTGPATEDVGQKRDAKFDRLDKNKDGLLSLEEFEAAPHFRGNPDRARKPFNQMDVDRDGVLTKEEFASGETQSEEDGGEQSAGQRCLPRAGWTIPNSAGW